MSSKELNQPNGSFKVVVVMGTSGCGKSTISSKLSTRFNCPNFDGDDYHSQSSIEKMSQGIPLTDADREPWLKQISSQVIFNIHANESSDLKFIACSALKRKYRELLIDQVNNSTKYQVDVLFLYLKTDIEVIERRVSKRKDHFMSSQLVKSQFKDLQEPELDEKFVKVDANLELDQVVEESYTKVKAFFGI